VLLVPAQLVVNGSNGGNWIEGTSNTPPNVAKLESPPFYMTATAKSIPGVTGSLNILQDAEVIAKVTYTDGSWTSCQTPGWIADYNPWWLPQETGPNAQGNLICTSSDQPRLPLLTVARNQVSEVLYSGSLRDFATLQVSGSTEVIAEAVWSFNLSATFTPDGVFESHFHAQQILTQPVVPGTVYGTTPTDQPVEPRDQSGNAYILNSSHWNANGNNQSDYAHQHPYPIP
jgi:hypothetical protein